MPYKEKEIEKLYYTIGEVADMFGVNTSHIRFWSKEFDVIRPATNKKGNRLYTASDLDNFRKIYHLVKEKGFTLKGAKIELKEMKHRTKTEETAPEPVHESLLQDNPVENVSLSDSDFSGNLVERMAVLNSLEKMKSELTGLQRELEKLEA